jgi:DNA mismatch repair protein MSH6
MKMVGIPESHFNHYASKLLSLGYKVGRVEQMETSIGMEKRQRQEGGKDAKVLSLSFSSSFCLSLLLTPSQLVVGH